MAFSVIETRDVMVPMRDGVRLAADIWRPDTDAPAPVLVSRTPYGKAMIALMSAPVELAEAGFAVVLQDCRGRFGSQGDWGYVHCEVEDGYDTVEWAAHLPWSDGRVDTYGQSYLCAVQYLMAPTRPPHLRATRSACLTPPLRHRPRFPRAAEN